MKLNVFVLETKPQSSVAHLHVVEHDGKHWRYYTRLGDFLRRSSTARHYSDLMQIDFVPGVHMRLAAVRADEHVARAHEYR